MCWPVENPALMQASLVGAGELLGVRIHQFEGEFGFWAVDRGRAEARPYRWRTDARLVGLNGEILRPPSDASG